MATPRARGWGASLQPTVNSLRSDVAALAALGRLRPPSLNSVVALASLGQLCPSSLRSVVALASLVHLAPLGHLPRCARLLPSVTSLRSDVAALAALGHPFSLRSVVVLASLGHLAPLGRCRPRCARSLPSLRSVTFARPRCARSLPSATSLRSDVAALAALGRCPRFARAPRFARTMPPSLRSVVGRHSKLEKSALAALALPSLRSCTFFNAVFCALASLVHLFQRGFLHLAALALGHLPRYTTSDLAHAARQRCTHTVTTAPPLLPSVSHTSIGRSSDFV